MKKDIVILIKSVNLVCSEVYTWSGYKNENEACIELLKKGFTFDVQKQVFIKENDNKREIAKIVDLTF